MNSPIKFLRRVRIHGGECGAVARALHHKAKFSSPAVFGNVSSTTYERKQMTNKSTSFKRIALALVAALGFGVLSTGPSNALLSQATSTIALSASSASAAQGETVTITGTVNFTSTVANESVSVIMNNLGGASGTNDITEVARGLTADSINVITKAQGDALPALNYLETRATRFSVHGSTNPESVVATSADPGLHIYSNASSATPVAVQAKFSLDFRVGTTQTAGVNVYTVTLRTYNGTTASNQMSVPFTLTVTAKDTTATAAKSQLFVNAALCATSLCDGLLSGNGSSADAFAIEADSTLVVSAGTPATGGTQSYTEVGYMFGVFRNAADTVTVTGTDVTATITVSISGPGALTKAVGGAKVKSLTITSSSETITIWADGTPGVATITGYIGTTALTQAAKTVTFYGKVASVTLSETTVASRNGGAALSSDAGDSLTVGNNLVTFTMKDSAGNAVKTAAMNTNGALYCISSDTSVVGMATGTSTASYEAASIAATGVGACNLVVRKAGTATISVADESVVANSTFSASKTLTFAKAVNGTTKGIGTITFDKTTYNVGEKATITVTVKNIDGAVPGQLLVNGDAYATADVFPTLVQNREFSSVGTTATGASIGFGSSRTGKSFSLTDGTFVAGVETYVVYMPTVAGDVTLTGYTTDGTYDTATAVSVKVSVVDPNTDLINAATDAAAEAIDAANAATDAANLAAEAADAATVAAEEARDAADAATAAVEELATAVATLMAALKAQVTTLANTVAKIAKKVGVKK